MTKNNIAVQAKINGSYPSKDQPRFRRIGSWAIGAQGRQAAVGNIIAIFTDRTQAAVDTGIIRGFESDPDNPGKQTIIYEPHDYYIPASSIKWRQTGGHVYFDYSNRDQLTQNQILIALSLRGVDIKRLNRSIHRIRRSNNMTWRESLAKALQITAGYEGLHTAAAEYCQEHGLYTPWTDLGQER